MSLPSDIVAEILYRFPADDLLRYRLVCRQWRNLIDGPDFIKTHLRHHRDRRSTSCVIILSTHQSELLFRSDLRRPKSAGRLANPIEAGPGGGATQVLGSCDGLLALQGNSSDAIVLWNPTTRRFRTLPACPVGVPEPRKHGYHLAVVYGFGHNPIDDDYKLVRMAQGDRDQSTGRFRSEIKVYSAKANAWKSVGHEFLDNYGLDTLANLSHGVLLGNALHWVALRAKPSGTARAGRKRKFTSVAFDLATEEPREVVLPPYFFEPSNGVLGVMRGCLCVSLNSCFGRAEIWVMEEYGVRESWTKLFTFSPRDVPLGVIDYFDSFHVSLIAAVKRKGRDGVLLNINSKVIWYDMITQKARKMWVHKTRGDCNIKPIVCVRSLVGLENTSVCGEFGWNKVEEDENYSNDDDEGLHIKVKSVHHFFGDDDHQRRRMYSRNKRGRYKKI